VQFKPGESGNPTGRPKGAINKTTLAVKEAIEEAFDELGGVPALVQWARRDPEAFYSKLWAKLIPKNIEIKGVLSLEQLVEASMKLIEAKVVESAKLEGAE